MRLGGSPHPRLLRLKAWQVSAASPPRRHLATATRRLLTPPEIGCLRPRAGSSLKLDPLGVTWLLFQGRHANVSGTCGTISSSMGEKVIFGTNRCSFTPPPPSVALLSDAAKRRGGVMKEIRTDNTEWREGGAEPDTPVGPRGTPYFLCGASFPCSPLASFLNILKHAGCRQRVMPSAPTFQL